MTFEPDLSSSLSSAPSSEASSVAPDSSASTSYLPAPETARARALSASQVPLPSSYPVFLTPPSENPIMVEMTSLPIPLQNNLFVVGQFEKSKAIELCGPALADISKDDYTVSAKGDFIETRNSFLALALKKAYDHMFGVGKDGVISPYTITSGGQGERASYRISYREPPSNTGSPRSVSKSSGRRSVHNIMRAMTQTSQNETNIGSVRKKLHKSQANYGGGRSRSGTTGSYKSTAVTDDSGPRDRLPLKLFGSAGETTDLFAELLNWDPRSHSQKSSSSQRHHTSESHSEHSRPRLPTTFAYRPFGEDIMFSVPSKPARTLANTLRVDHTLRLVSSFDSIRTARATDRGAGPELAAEDTFHPPEDNQVEDKCRPEVFEVLQTFTGIRQREPASSTEPGNASSIVAPEDDPRFVLWGTHVTPTDGLGPGISSSDSRLPGARERMMIAASIERWIAQLTSVLDYDGLLNFYLTFRTSITAVDLCRLLICRFQWSLDHAHSSVDASVRKIVRVRTFVAFKYWIQTFFAVDFLPNRDLRMLLADWLNTARENPHIAENRDALIIVDKLRKITRECRDMHLKKSVYHKEGAPGSQSQPHLALGDAADTAKNSPGGVNQDCPCTLDLDLEKYGDMSAAASNVRNRLDLAATIGPASLQPTKSTAAESKGHNHASANSIMLQHSIRMQILSSNPASALITTATDGNALPQHSTLSRVFVSAFGRLGRWRRELTSRSRNPTSLNCVAGLDLEADSSYAGDLLTTKDGLDQYLKKMNIQTGSEQESLQSTLAPSVDNGATAEQTADNASSSVLDINPTVHRDRVLDAGTVPVDVDADDAEQLLQDDLDDGASNTAGSSNPIVPPGLHPEIVSLDDYQFSDSDGSGYGVEAPSGWRPGKRLPLRRELERDFELIGRESVSSLGAVSREASEVRDSVASGDSVGGPSGVEGWQLQVMLDSRRSEESDEEPGDVTAALRRLEGQIDASQQRVKETQVEGWLKTVARVHRERQHRLEGSDYTPSETGSESEPSTPPDDALITENPHPADAADFIEPNIVPANSDPTSAVISSSAEVAPNLTSPKENEFAYVSQRSGNRFAPVQSLRPQVHRSFILQYSSDQLARQWCLIDRDFFLAVKFEELTFEDQSWKQLRMHSDVTDWSLFMKERMKIKLEASMNPKVKMPTSIATSRLRFNMMVSFVASEIILTVPHERIDVVSKFIRIAWKSYTLNNYHAVVAIMTALQTRWVIQAVGKMGSKLGMWESRLFADLQYFTAPNNDFQLIRQSVTGMMPSTTGKETMDDPQNSGQPSACVPFIGMYLSQLYKHNQLPQYIDPTSPLDPVAPTATREDLCRPEVFSDLPPIPSFMSVKPLLNVHKQQLLATVIKSLVAGQNLASQVSHPVDQKLYWKCMRLKCLDHKALEQLSSRRDV